MDAGQERLEKEFEKLSKQLRKEYSQASKEVEAKLNTYLKKFEKKDEIKRAAVRSGALSKSEYEQWRVGQVAIGERWKEMRDVLAQDLTNTDKIARSMINGKMPDAYAIGHNYATFTVEKGSLVDTSYTLYNRNAVMRLVQDSPGLLPSKFDINIPKDLRWNRQHIQSAVTQGLLQGDRIPNIAKRLRNVTNMDYKASVRNARTAMTSAHNKGRLDSLFRAKSMGIEVAKEWVAYVDNVTRDSHIDVNGEVVPIEKTFSNGLDAPGGMGPPEEVYNCRCTMVAAFPKDKKAEDRLSKAEDDGSYDEWSSLRESESSIYEKIGDKKFSEFADSLPTQQGREFLKEVYRASRETGKTNAEYFNALKKGEMTNPEVERILRSALGGEKMTSSKIAKTAAANASEKELKEKGLEYLDVWRNGGIIDVHSWAGYNAMSDDFLASYTSSKVDEAKMKALDSVFTPAKEEMTVYRGASMSAEEIERLSDKSHVIRTLSSTSKSSVVAEDYASRALDMDWGEYYPVELSIKVEKGTPVADIGKLLDTEGHMSAYEKEITIGRNVEWEYGKMEKQIDRFGEERYTCDVIVRRAK